MSGESIHKRLSTAIIAGDKDKLLGVVDKAIQGGMTPADIIEKGMSPGMRKILVSISRLIYRGNKMHNV